MSHAALVILNPVSGRGRATRLWWRLRRGLQVRFPHLVVYETTGPRDAGRRAAAWAEAGERGPILLMGGDGTLHEVVNELFRGRWNLPIGVIPSGTGNDFARNAGIPLDPDLAAGRLEEGSGKPLDLGRLSFRDRAGVERSVVFLNSTSVGVSPVANRHARRLGYVAGGVVALLTAPRRRFTVTEAGRIIHEGKTLNITVANGAGFGGGLRISPDSSPWDGVLERVIIGRIELGRALLAFARLRRGGHVGMREVSITRTAGTTVIEPEGALTQVEADGHDFLAAGRITVSVEAAAIRVLGTGS